MLKCKNLQYNQWRMHNFCTYKKVRWAVEKTCVRKKIEVLFCGGFYNKIRVLITRCMIKNISNEKQAHQKHTLFMPTTIILQL